MYNLYVAYSSVNSKTLTYKNWLLSSVDSIACTIFLKHIFSGYHTICIWECSLQSLFKSSCDNWLLIFIVREKLSKNRIIITESVVFLDTLHAWLTPGIHIIYCYSNLIFRTWCTKFSLLQAVIFEVVRVTICIKLSLWTITSICREGGQTFSGIECRYFLFQVKHNFWNKYFGVQFKGFDQIHWPPSPG